MLQYHARLKCACNWWTICISLLKQTAYNYLNIPSIPYTYLRKNESLFYEYQHCHFLVSTGNICSQFYLESRDSVQYSTISFKCFWIGGNKILNKHFTYCSIILQSLLQYLNLCNAKPTAHFDTVIHHVLLQNITQLYPIDSSTELNNHAHSNHDACKSQKESCLLHLK